LVHTVRFGDDPSCAHVLDELREVAHLIVQVPGTGIGPLRHPVDRRRVTCISLGINGLDQVATDPGAPKCRSDEKILQIADLPIMPVVAVQYAIHEGRDPVFDDADKAEAIGAWWIDQSREAALE
jgi:hypothetical protein